MQFKLKQLAGTKTGLVLNRKKASLQSDFQKKYNVVSLKSFNSNGIYDHSYKDEFIASEEIKEDFHTRKGDILLRLREPNFAVYIEEDYEDLIFSSLSIVVRIEDERILPEYLTYYLNSNFVISQLKQEITTTAIRMIKLIDVNNLDINVPNIEKQKLIIEAMKTFNQEEVLLNKLIVEKQNLKNSVFKTALKEEK